VFENRALRKVKKEQEAGENCVMGSFMISFTVAVIKLRRIWWAGNVGHV
jgi:hypothetical protein